MTGLSFFSISSVQGVPSLQFPCENQKLENTLHIQGSPSLNLGSHFVLYVIRSCFACMFVYNSLSLPSLSLSLRLLSIGDDTTTIEQYLLSPSHLIYLLQQQQAAFLYFLAIVSPFFDFHCPRTHPTDLSIELVLFTLGTKIREHPSHYHQQTFLFITLEHIEIILTQ